MERLPEIHQDIVGQIYDDVDRPQADRLQASNQPGRTGPGIDIEGHPGGVPAAAIVIIHFDTGDFIERVSDRVLRDLWKVQRQRLEWYIEDTGQFPGYAAMTQVIWTVRCHLEFEYMVRPMRFDGLAIETTHGEFVRYIFDREINLHMISQPVERHLHCIYSRF